MSDADATAFDRELGIKRDGSERDTPLLTHLPPHTAAVKLLDRIPTNAYDSNHLYMRTIPPSEHIYGYGEDIIHSTRINYATPRTSIRKYIQDWYDMDAGDFLGSERDFEFE